MNFANTRFRISLISKNSHDICEEKFPCIYTKKYLELKAWTSVIFCISNLLYRFFTTLVLLWDLRIFCWLVVASATKPRPLEEQRVWTPINSSQVFVPKLPMKNVDISLVSLFVGPPFVVKRKFYWLGVVQHRFDMNTCLTTCRQFDSTLQCNKILINICLLVTCFVSLYILYWMLQNPPHNKIFALKNH
jgi:hypothetical protein